MWALRVGRIPQIETKTGELHPRQDDGAKILASRDVGQILGPEAVKHVRGAAEQSGNGGRNIQTDTPDDPVELRPTPIIRRVGNDLDRRPLVPLSQAKSTAAYR